MTLDVAVRHSYGDGDFAIDVAFSSGGGVTAFFGRSGAGKSSLGNIVAGLVKPREGKIAVGGRVMVDTSTGVFVPLRQRRIGVVFQEGRLFPHLSVRQNLLFGRRFLPRRDRHVDIAPVVDLLDIGALLDRRPRLLSGGEQQRVAIGRALLAKPRALVMDEPLASIDRPRRAEILPYLDRLRSEMRIPIIYISHAVDEIARLADTVVVIDAGRVLAVGPTAEILSRLDLAPLAEMEHGSILAGKVRSVDRERRQCAVDHAAGLLTIPDFTPSVGSLVRVRVHARDVALAVGDPGRLSIRNRLPARVVALAASRGTVDVQLDVAGSPLLASLTADAVADLGLAPGIEVTALIKAVAVEGY